MILSILLLSQKNFCLGLHLKLRMLWSIKKTKMVAPSPTRQRRHRHTQLEMLMVWSPETGFPSLTLYLLPSHAPWCRPREGRLLMCSIACCTWNCGLCYWLPALTTDGGEDGGQESCFRCKRLTQSAINLISSASYLIFAIIFTSRERE